MFFIPSEVLDIGALKHSILDKRLRTPSLSPDMLVLFSFKSNSLPFRVSVLLFRRSSWRMLCWIFALLWLLIRIPLCLGCRLHVAWWTWALQSFSEVSSLAVARMCLLCKSCTLASRLSCRRFPLPVLAEGTAALSGNISIKLVPCDAYGGLPKANCANWQEPIL